MFTYTLPTFTLNVSSISNTEITGTVEFTTGTLLEFTSKIKNNYIDEYPLGHGYYNGHAYVDTAKITHLPVSAFIKVDNPSDELTAIAALDNDLGELLDTLVEEKLD